MRIVIAGGHGQIALLLARRLQAAGDRSVGLIRNDAHAPDVRDAGGEPVLVDLEQASARDLSRHLAGADAVVFAAGAGPGSSAARKETVDRDGATLLASAAEIAGVRRYVLVSAMAADFYDPASEEIFQVYLRAKSEADGVVRASSLDWTIVRPGGLTDDAATGTVTIARDTGRGSIPRDDVAAVVQECLRQPATGGAQFEVISGDTPIAEALAVAPRP